MQNCIYSFFLVSILFNLQSYKKVDAYESHCVFES